MGKSRYPETLLQRDHLRDALRRRGRDSTDEIAAAIREQWGHRRIRSYRLALELSLEQVCAQVNRILGVFAGVPGYLDHSTLSKMERVRHEAPAVRVGVRDRHRRSVAAGG